MENRSRSHLLSVAGRVLVGFLVAGYVSSYSMQAVEAASVGSEPSKCSRENLAQILEDSKTDSETNSLTQSLLETCTDEFLQSNSINPAVKKTIDQWLGLDLSQASAIQLLEAYEKVLNERPEAIEGDAEFTEGCREMLKKYEEFRDTTSVLADSVDGVAIIVNEDQQGSEFAGSEGAKTLLSYAQYGLFCSALIDN